MKIKHAQHIWKWLPGRIKFWKKNCHAIAERNWYKKSTNTKILLTEIFEIQSPIDFLYLKWSKYNTQNTGDKLESLLCTMVMTVSDDGAIVTVGSCFPPFNSHAAVACLCCYFITHSSILNVQTRKAPIISVRTPKRTPVPWPGICPCPWSTVPLLLCLADRQSLGGPAE